MALEILVHDDLSLSDLVKILQEGGVVLKTPHVGNVYPNNLLIASLGIPMLFYDRTIGAKDGNFHPDRIIMSGNHESISDRNILVTHARLIDIPLNLDPLLRTKFTKGDSLVDFHMTAVKRALPNSNCFTYSEYLHRNQEIIRKILEEITNVRPDLWLRKVDDFGWVSTCKVKNWSDVLRYGVFGVTNSKSGLLVPNLVNVLFHGTIDITEHAVNEVYLLSGPDMYQYIPKYANQLNSLYLHLFSKLTLNLPQNLRCHIIPVANARFIVKLEHQSALDKLLAAYLKFASLKISINFEYKNNQTISEVNNNFKSAKMKIKKEIRSILLENSKLFKRTIFYDIKDANCLTQYDLLNSGRIYIHPWAVTSKLSEVSKAYHFLEKLFLSIDNVEYK